MNATPCKCYAQLPLVFGAPHRRGSTSIATADYMTFRENPIPPILEASSPSPLESSFNGTTLPICKNMFVRFLLARIYHNFTGN